MKDQHQDGVDAIAAVKPPERDKAVTTSGSFWTSVAAGFVVMTVAKVAAVAWYVSTRKKR